MTRLAQQLRFIAEIDRLKAVVRRTPLLDRSRRETDAEHSWHIAMMAVVLAEYAPEPVDVKRVVEMLLVHDLVEIDAGDAFVYDTAARAAQEEREHAAARRIFGLLPPDQDAGLRALWQEFEEKRSPEALFAHAVDRLQPILHNAMTEGGTWVEHGVTADKVEAIARRIEAGAPALAKLVRDLAARAVVRGHLSPSPAGAKDLPPRR
jgi:putative hydrolase of HD superfamily